MYIKIKYTELSVKTTIIVLLLLLTHSLLIADYSGTVTTNQNELIFEQKDGYDLISIDKVNYTRKEGAPKLPVKIFKYIIPVEKNPVNILIENTDSTAVSGNYNIYPVQTPSPLMGVMLHHLLNQLTVYIIQIHPILIS